MVFTRTVDVEGQIDFAKINGFATDLCNPWFDEVIFQIGVAQIPGIHGPRQIGGIAVPVEQVKRRRCFAFEVIAHHVVPYQIVGTQKAEGRRHVFALHQTTVGKLAFAVFDKVLVYEHVQHTSVLKVNQGGEESGTGHGLFAARCQNGQGVGEDGAAHAKTQCVDLFGRPNFLHH